jgi:hypothetical protein
VRLRKLPHGVVICKCTTQYFSPAGPLSGQRCNHKHSYPDNHDPEQARHIRQHQPRRLQATDLQSPSQPDPLKSYKNPDNIKLPKTRGGRTVKILAHLHNKNVPLAARNLLNFVQALSVRSAVMKNHSIVGMIGAGVLWTGEDADLGWTGRQEAPVEA